MADFTLSAPGTTNSPWAPANVILAVSTIKSDATGFRASTAGVNATFAHNVTYGSTIEATATLATTGSGSDDVIVGAAVRSGANAGGIIGVLYGITTASVVSATAAGAITGISAAIAITRAAADVFDVVVSISGGVATISGKQNGTSIAFGTITTTTFAAEASLAAGAQFVPDNSNTLYLSQFTGTGVVASGSSFLVRKAASGGVITLSGGMRS